MQQDTAANLAAYEKMITREARDIFCKLAYKGTHEKAVKDARKKFPYNAATDYTKIIKY